MRKKRRRRRKEREKRGGQERGASKEAKRSQPPKVQLLMACAQRLPKHGRSKRHFERLRRGLWRALSKRESGQSLAAWTTAGSQRREREKFIAPSCRWIPKRRATQSSRKTRRRRVLRATLIVNPICQRHATRSALSAARERERRRARAEGRSALSR